MGKITLSRAAGIVAFLTVVSRIFGFTREASLAAVFGATEATDAYLMAQVIPLMLLGIVSYALTTTFIPVYSQVRAEEGRTKAFRMANTVIRVVFLIGVALVVIGEVLAEPVVGLIAPGFDKPLISLTVYVSRIIFPMMLFQLLSGVVTGMLHAEEQFIAPEIGGVIQNTSVIAATLIFGPHYGITAVAYGLLLGVIGSLIIKLPALARIGFRIERVLDLSDPRLRQMLILIVPAIIGAGATQLNVLVDRILASNLPEGRITALNYAVRLNALAPGILGTSIITVLYPTLAERVARQDWGSFANYLVRSLGIVHFLLAPVAVGTMVLRLSLVRIVYERGVFDTLATEATAWALLFLAVGMALTSMQALMGRAFFALQDTTTPMYIGIASVAVNITANLLLVGQLEQGGLALGTSIASLFGFTVSAVIIGRRIPVIPPWPSFISSVVRVLVASGIMGVFIWAIDRWIRSVVLETTIATDIGILAATIMAGVIIYGVLSRLLRIPEFEFALESIRTQFGRICRVLKS